MIKRYFPLSLNRLSKSFSLTFPHYWTVNIHDNSTVEAQQEAISLLVDKFTANTRKITLPLVEKQIYTVVSTSAYSSKEIKEVNNISYEAREKLIISTSNLVSFLYEKRFFSDNLDKLAAILIENLLQIGDLANKKHHPYINIHLLLYILNCETLDFSVKRSVFLRFMLNFKHIRTTELVEFLHETQKLSRANPKIKELFSPYNVFDNSYFLAWHLERNRILTVKDIAKLSLYLPELKDSLTIFTHLSENYRYLRSVESDDILKIVKCLHFIDVEGKTSEFKSFLVDKLSERLSKRSNEYFLRNNEKLMDIVENVADSFSALGDRVLLEKLINKLYSCKATSPFVEENMLSYLEKLLKVDFGRIFPLVEKEYERLILEGKVTRNNFLNIFRLHLEKRPIPGHFEGYLVKIGNEIVKTVNLKAFDVPFVSDAAELDQMFNLFDHSALDNRKAVLEAIKTYREMLKEDGI